MSFIPPNPSFICQRCIRKLSPRLFIHQAAPPRLQTRHLRSSPRRGPGRTRQREEIAERGGKGAEISSKFEARDTSAPTETVTWDALDFGFGYKIGEGSKEEKLTGQAVPLRKKKMDPVRKVPIREQELKVREVTVRKPETSYARKVAIRKQEMRHARGVPIHKQEILEVRKVRHLKMPDLNEMTPFVPSKGSSHYAYNPAGSDNFNLYWETLPPNISEKNQAGHFFTSIATPQFLRSVANFRDFPEGDVPEVAFVGKSNVGKSSLINAIANADVRQAHHGVTQILAKVSKTPGYTKTMNLYGIGGGDGVRIRPGKNNGHDRIIGIGGVVLVDLPGYGAGALAEWGTEIMKYLTNRRQLRRVFVVIAAQYGITEKDKSLLATLRAAGIPHQVVIAKVDRIYIPQAKSIVYSANRGPTREIGPLGNLESLGKMMEKVRADIKPGAGSGALGELLGVSAHVMVDGKRLGIDALRFAIMQAAGYKFATKTWRRSEDLVRTVKNC